MPETFHVETKRPINPPAPTGVAGLPIRCVPVISGNRWKGQNPVWRVLLAKRGKEARTFQGFCLTPKSPKTNIAQVSVLENRLYLSQLPPTPCSPTHTGCWLRECHISSPPSRSPGRLHTSVWEQRWAPSKDDGTCGDYRSCFPLLSTDTVLQPSVSTRASQTQMLMENAWDCSQTHWTCWRALGVTPGQPVPSIHPFP